jgi:hypothetical protein
MERGGLSSDSSYDDAISSLITLSTPAFGIANKKSCADISRQRQNRSFRSIAPELAASWEIESLYNASDQKQRIV